MKTRTKYISAGLVAALVVICFIVMPPTIQLPRKTGVCYSKLRAIGYAKEYYGEEHGLIVGKTILTNATLTIDQILPYLNNMRCSNVVCPTEGKYTIGALGEPATCSIHGRPL